VRGQLPGGDDPGGAAAGERRAAQTRLFRRNQIFGLLLFAAIILFTIPETKGLRLA
jgi:hypothetical protein